MSDKSFPLRVGQNLPVSITATTISATTISANTISLVSTTGSLILNRLTTTQRNALTPIGGTIVFDITLSLFFGYDGTNWIQF